MLTYGKSMLNNIIDFIDNRPIIIISGSKVIGDLHTDAIVVRLNSSRRWGSCDIWFNNQSQPTYFQEESRGIGDEQWIIRANGDNKGANMKRNYPTDWKHTYFWPVEDWEEMVKEMSIARPLTGTIATYWFHRYTRSQIHLLNFDYYETIKIHAVKGTPGPPPVHKPWLDKAWILGLDRVEHIYS